jgi:hypothetical protein
MIAALKPSKYYTVRDADDVLTLVFRVEQDSLLMLQGVVWVGFWFSGVAIFVWPLISAGPDGVNWEAIPASAWIFLLPLLFLTAGILWLGLDVLWELFGRETVTITADQISLRHDLLNWHIKKTFQADTLNGLYVSKLEREFLMRSMHRSPIAIGFYSFTRGKIAFNSGRALLGGPRTFRFGTVLDGDEARQIVAIILKKFPHYQYDSRYLP